MDAALSGSMGKDEKAESEDRPQEVEGRRKRELHRERSTPCPSNAGLLLSSSLEIALKPLLRDLKKLTRLLYTFCGVPCAAAALAEGSDVLMLNRADILSDKLERKLRNLDQRRRSSVVSGMKVRASSAW